MKVVRDWKHVRIGRSAVAIGVFDGVHRGHLAILKRAVAEARRRKLRSVALTMDPHPSEVLRPDRPVPLLYSPEHRIELLRTLGFGTVVVLKFDRALARIPAADFAREILAKRLGARAIWVGTNFKFGRGAEGNADFLRRHPDLRGCAVRAVRPVLWGGRPVSSSRIRQAVTAGRLEAASELLGRPYSLFGTVVRGDARGRQLGFPTLNLDLDHDLLPPPGVYAVRARRGAKRYPGVLHLGPRPTFGSAAFRAECHLLEAPGRSLYGARFELVPVKLLRAVRRFPDAGALIAQIRRDVRSAGVALQKPREGVYSSLHKAR